ncbi:MAG: hypothetical protein RJA76_1265 [Bacteroidota bacterium]|jgi:membrane associated rhomboid family serine protease
MDDIWNDIKSIFTHPQKGLMKIIITNCIIFMAIIATKVIFILGNDSLKYNTLFNWISLSNQYTFAYYKPWTFISYFFVHAEIFHLLFNMAILYWFGTILSDFTGEKQVVKLYFLGGIAGGIAYLLVSNSLSYFIMRGPALLNGASASIYAIVVAAATIRPNYRVSLFFFGMIPIKYISIFYVIWSFIETTGGNAGGNIAHLGGALMGYLFGLNFRKKWIIHQTERPKVVSYIGSLKSEFYPHAEQEESEIEEDELNEILDKISKSGYDSLNKFEKRRLFKASQKNN